VTVSIWAAADWHSWSTTLQVVGSLVTAIGLAGAYVRSRYGLTPSAYVHQQVVRGNDWAKGVWRRLLRKRRDINIDVGPMVITVNMGRPTIEVRTPPLKLDVTASVEQQLAQLAAYVNRINEKLPDFDRRIDKLTIDAESMKAEIANVEPQILAHIQAEIDALNKRLDIKQVVDLRWAILGVLITTVGVLLSY
jgi:hypothetical protein